MKRLSNETRSDLVIRAELRLILISCPRTTKSDMNFLHPTPPIREDRCRVCVEIVQLRLQLSIDRRILRTAAIEEGECDPVSFLIEIEIPGGELFVIFELEA
jgi:hypothetical protein